MGNLLFMREDIPLTNNWAITQTLKMSVGCLFCLLMSKINK